MLKVKGIYDGKNIVLLNPLALPPNTAVEVVITEPLADPERDYWQTLFELGLISKIQKPSAAEQLSFEPVRVSGIPLSETIIEERR